MPFRGWVLKASAASDSERFQLGSEPQKFWGLASGRFLLGSVLQNAVTEPRPAIEDFACDFNVDFVN